MSQWLAWVTFAAAVTAMPVTVWATRRWGSRRKRLDLSVTATPLLPTNVRSGLLEVSYRDIPLENPYLVSVSFRNSGPRDIASTTFDSNRPIAIHFDQAFYGITHRDGDPCLISDGIGSREKYPAVTLQPKLLKKGNTWSFSAVTTGPVEVTVEAPLIDTEIRNIGSTSQKDLTVRMTLLGLALEVPRRHSAATRRNN